MNKAYHDPLPVKLFAGMLSQEVSLFEIVTAELRRLFGDIDMESPVWSWEHTSYYEKEMGAGLKRKFVFFEKLINPEMIPDIKLKTIELERQYLNENNPPSPPFNKGGKGGFKGGRRINLDPGYLDAAKVVLVSTKDFSHRIYLGKGIYGEVTLIYSGKNYRILPFTYPDFRTPEYLDVFKKARELYKRQVKER
ncbi:MAG: DUF4416 family protein [Nitrospirae bacterium]|nr:DUF4416 family protein [Nitrospirota bacterium]